MPTESLDRSLFFYPFMLRLHLYSQCSLGSPFSLTLAQPCGSGLLLSPKLKQFFISASMVLSSGGGYRGPERKRESVQ